MQHGHTVDKMRSCKLQLKCALVNLSAVYNVAILKKVSYFLQASFLQYGLHYYRYIFKAFHYVCIYA